MKIPRLLQIPCGTEASYNNRITTKYKKTGKEHKEHIQLWEGAENLLIF